MGGALAFGCGQCTPCRIGHRKVWTARQILESFTHEENCFITLTYSENDRRKSGDPCLPEDGRVSSADLRNFFKRLRERLGPGQPIRFYAVAEYGDTTARPHYHASLFGVSGRTDILSRSGTVRHFGVSRAVFEAWGLGHVFVTEFNRKTAQYVASHHLKRGDNIGFRRMSLRPGIGAVSVPVLLQALSRHPTLSLAEGNFVRINGQKEYIGPYLTRKLTEARQPDAKEVQKFKDEKSLQRSLEMLALHADYKGDTFRQSFQKSILGKIASIEARDKIWQSKRSL